MNRRNKKKFRKKKAPKKKPKSKKNILSKLETTGPIYSQIENPFQGMSDSEIKNIIDEIGNSNQTNFKEALNKLEIIIKKYNPILLISILSYYGLSVSIDDGGVDINKNRIVKEIEQSHIEFLQAKILHLGEAEFGKVPPTPEVVQDTIELLQKINFTFSFSRLKSEQIEGNETEKAILFVQELIRGHTQVVRNWGYHSQVVNISKELYGPFDNLILKKFGYTSTNIIEVFEFMLDELEKRLSSRFEDIRKLFVIKNKEEFVCAYHKIIGLGKNKCKEFLLKIDINRLTKRELQSLTLSHYDLFIADLYFFDSKIISNQLKIEEEQVENILNMFSYSLGELKNKNEEYFFLTNPIWLKPVFKLDSIYFCPMPQLFFSFILQIMDGVIEDVSKDALKIRRSKFLENKIEKIVKKRFPNSLTIKGLKWKYNNKNYETDLITFMDSFVLIIEAKSHKITDPALRGAPDRTKKHIEKIIVEPANQSWRLQQKLLELKKQPETNDDLLKILPVGIQNISKIIRISISLEDFATLQNNLSIIEKTGWFPKNFHPCPTMNLADFEILFDLLEHPVQIIHYLSRRQEVEREFNIQGDELDFIGLYRDTLFNLGNIKDVKPGLMSITNMSKDIDYYYNSLDAGIKVEKPVPRINKMFKDILNQLENRETPRWTEIGVLLNYISPKLQADLEKTVKRYEKIVQKSWQHEGHKNMIIVKPTNNSICAIAIVLYKDGNSDKKKIFMERAALLAFENYNVKKCIVIAKNIDHPELAYHSIGLFE